MNDVRIGQVIRSSRLMPAYVIQPF